MGRGGQKARGGLVKEARGALLWPQRGWGQFSAAALMAGTGGPEFLVGIWVEGATAGILGREGEKVELENQR